MPKAITEVNNEFLTRVNEPRTQEEVNEFLRDYVSRDIKLPSFVDIFLSQVHSNTYLARIVRYETNTEQDLNIYLNIPLATTMFRDFVSGFTEGDLIFIRESIIPDNLKNILLRKLVFIGSDNVILEVRGVSPSLITQAGNTFMYKNDINGNYLYWHNQHYSSVGILSWSKKPDIFIQGFVSLGIDTNLPGSHFPLLYDWIKKNPDNILSIDEEKELIIFPQSTGAYLQIRNNNFPLDKGSLTIPKDTNPQPSSFYAAGDTKDSIKIKEDITGDNIVYLSPTSVTREERISLTKQGRLITRLENSRGINILIKAV